MAVTLSLIGTNTGLDLVESQINTMKHTIQSAAELATDLRVLSIFNFVFSKKVLTISLIVLIIVLMD